MADEPSEEFLAELAGRIADGHPLDWSGIERDPRITPPRLRALRAIAGLRDSSVELTRADPAAAGAPVDEAAAELAQGFELRGRLGRGSFGEVYRAFDMALQREVALKVIPADAPATREQRTSFIREARVLASLDHPNIVRIFQIDEHLGALRLSLELVDGRTLSELVAAAGVFAPEEAARVGAEICRALAAVHGKGLVHRDVKPANVMRAAGGRIVLLDFGMTRATDAGTGRAGAGARVKTGGTPLFLPPECFEPGVLPQARDDLYALGVTLYFLVTGRYPYEASDLAELQEKLRAGRLTPLVDRRADVPAAFATVVERAIARDPAARFDSAGAMESALRGFLAGEEARARPVARSVARRVLLAGAGLAAVAAVAAAISAIFQRWIAPRPPLSIQCELVRERDGFEQPLRSGDEVAAGDLIHVNVRTGEPAWLYVLNEDLAGSVHALFPDPERGPANPLRPSPGEPTRLPPSGRWQVDEGESGGGESFVVIATRGRIAWLEDAIAPLARPVDREASAAELARRFESGVRGTGTYVAESAARERPPAAQRLGVFAQLVRRLEESGEIGSDVAVEIVSLSRSR